MLVAVEALVEDPRASGCRKLAGADTNYRIRVGDVRVIYSIQDDQLVVQVIRAGHRGRV